MQVRDSQFELIIFDLDETLIEIPHAYDFFDGLIIETLKKIGITPIPLQTERDRLWRTGKEYIEILKSWGIENPVQFWSIFDELDFDRRKQLILKGEIKPFYDTAPTLEKLKSLNIKLAILTNTIRRITDYTLHCFGLARFIDYTLALGDTQEKCKPEPDGVFEILNFFSILPEHAAMVGDSQNDMEAGLKAKVRCFRIMRDHLKSSKNASSGYNFSIISSLTEIFNFI